MSINLLEERHIFHRQLTDSHTLGVRLVLLTLR